ncbi:hypothetical protein [Streptomyces sp. NPDC050856]|uniref:hypothetical protein n=1 Tax=Streptomyces sp. NPDC050856 TaxID=3154939 RepID=UPI0033D646DC
MPNPFSIEAFCERLAEQRQRPIHLHPMPPQAAVSGMCGLLLATDTDDHIFFERCTVLPHQEHIVLHEIGHLLFDHHELLDDDATGRLVPGGLLPDLHPGLIRRLLGRSRYTTRQELQAETFADLLRTGHGRVGRRGESAGVLDRLQAAMGLDP